MANKKAKKLIVAEFLINNLEHDRQDNCSICDHPLDESKFYIKNKYTLPKQLADQLGFGKAVEKGIGDILFYNRRKVTGDIARDADIFSTLIVDAIWK